MRYEAEMWDKMQNIMERYNDHMVHTYIKFETTVKVDVIKKALAIVIDKVPILKCVYTAGFFHAEWNTIDNFSIDDVFTFTEVEKGDTQEISEKFLLQIINEGREAQIKILLLRSQGKDTLSILGNHMCFDGADLKEFLFLLSRVYNDLLNGGDGNLKFKNGSRSESQLFENFTEGEYHEAMNLVSYSKKQKAPISFPFEKAKKKNLIPKIIKNTIDAATFEKMKANAKMLGVSINDVVLGCFYRATLKQVTVPKGGSLGIPNMVDLRRYIKNGQSAGMCNLVSMVVCNLGADIGSNVFETVAKVKVNMDNLKGYYPGLHGLPLLRKVFGLTPNAVAKLLIGTFFKNPLIGVSNIGIIDDAKLQFQGARIEDMYVTGSVKYPPYMQLALCTFRNEIIHTVAVYGTSNDHKMFEQMYKDYNAEIAEFANGTITAESIKKMLMLLLIKANAENK